MTPDSVGADNLKRSVIKKMAGNRTPMLKDWLKGFDIKPTGTQNAAWSTGKAADSGYTAQKKAVSQAANRETLASAFGLSGSGNSTTRNVSSTLGVQLPTSQTGTQRTGISTAGRAATGLAADSGYTKQKSAASQSANRQVVQNWWKQPKRRLWRMKRGCFEEAARLADMKCPGIVTPRRWTRPLSQAVPTSTILPR